MKTEINYRIVSDENKTVFTSRDKKQVKKFFKNCNKKKTDVFVEILSNGKSLGLSIVTSDFI